MSVSMLNVCVLPAVAAVNRGLVNDVTALLVALLDSLLARILVPLLALAVVASVLLLPLSLALVLPVISMPTSDASLVLLSLVALLSPLVFVAISMATSPAAASTSNVGFPHNVTSGDSILDRRPAASRAILSRRI